MAGVLRVLTSYFWRPPSWSDCSQGSTVALTGNLKVYGAGGIMRTIDRSGLGRRTVSAGQTLMWSCYACKRGSVYELCSSPPPAGAAAHVSGSNAVLRFQDAWLSGGRAFYGGGVLAWRSHVYLNRTSISSNSAT